MQTGVDKRVPVLVASRVHVVGISFVVAVFVATTFLLPLCAPVALVVVAEGAAPEAQMVSVKIGGVHRRSPMACHVAFEGRVLEEHPGAEDGAAVGCAILSKHDVRKEELRATIYELTSDEKSKVSLLSACLAAHVLASAFLRSLRVHRTMGTPL